MADRKMQIDHFFVPTQCAASCFVLVDGIQRVLSRFPVLLVDEEVGRWFQGHVNRYLSPICSDIIYHSPQIFNFRKIAIDARAFARNDTTETETRKSHLKFLRYIQPKSTDESAVNQSIVVTEFDRERGREEEREQLELGTNGN